MLSVRSITIVRGVGAARSTPVQRLSFTVPEGTSCALLGPSGSGKTSVLLTVAGHIVPTTGSVDVDGASVPALTAFVHQDYRLVDFLSAEANVALPMELQGVDAEVAGPLARDLLSEVGLGGLENRRPEQLSGGQQQRVAIARALSGNPQVLCADEPTGALDRSTGLDVVELLLKAARERRAHCLVATHDLDVAGLCDQQVWLRDSERVMAGGTR